MDLIIHHGKCRDGWCAAYVAKKRYPEAKLLAVEYGLVPKQLEELWADVVGKDVLMLDYSLTTRELNDGLSKIAKSFQIFDHHKTAQAVLEGAPYAIFDMYRSGAGLTWDILFGNADCQSVLARPWYVDYVEDHDLWNHKLLDTLAINAYIATLPFTVEAWDRLRFMKAMEAADLGRGALAHVEHYVREIVKDAKTGLMAGCRIAILNAPYLNCSEVGHELAKTHDFSITWYEPGNGQVKFSLRSVGDIDVSRVAKRNGGGGHKNAAGFELPLREGRKLIDQIHNRRGELESSFADKREPGGCL